LLNRSINSFGIRHEEKAIEVCGLVFNDYTRRNEKREHRLARKDVQEKATEYGWYVFENDIPHSDSYYRAAREGMPIDRTKGTHGMVKSEFAAFADEFFGRIEL
jgi:chromosome partitioning protein